MCTKLGPSIGPLFLVNIFSLLPLCELKRVKERRRERERERVKKNLGSTRRGKGMPVTITARPFLSAKSIPSATFPRQTAKKTAPDPDSILLKGERKRVVKKEIERKRDEEKGKIRKGVRKKKGERKQNNRKKERKKDKKKTYKNHS